jgi:hypothetical protein
LKHLKFRFQHDATKYLAGKFNDKIFTRVVEL